MQFRKKFTSPTRVHPSTRRAISLIVELLTVEQLSYLEFSYKGEKYSFEEQMQFYCKGLYPSCKEKEFRFSVLVIIRKSETLLTRPLTIDEIQKFKSRFRHLFIEKPPSPIIKFIKLILQLTLAILRKGGESQLPLP